MSDLDVRRYERALERDGHDPLAVGAQLLRIDLERFWLVTRRPLEEGERLHEQTVPAAWVRAGKMPVLVTLDVDHRTRWLAAWAVSVATLAETFGLVELLKGDEAPSFVWDRHDKRVCADFGRGAWAVDDVTDGWREPRDGPPTTETPRNLWNIFPVASPPVIIRVTVSGPRPESLAERPPVYITDWGAISWSRQRDHEVPVGRVVRAHEDGTADVEIASATTVSLMDAERGLFRVERESNVYVDRFGAAQPLRDPPQGRGTLYPVAGIPPGTLLESRPDGSVAPFGYESDVAEYVARGRREAAIARAVIGRPGDGANLVRITPAPRPVCRCPLSMVCTCDHCARCTEVLLPSEAVGERESWRCPSCLSEERQDDLSARND